MSAVARAPAPGRRNSFLRDLRAALLADLEAELELCERVAVLYALGFKHYEIARKLGCALTDPALRAAERRVQSAAERLDHGD